MVWRMRSDSGVPEGGNKVRAGQRVPLLDLELLGQFVECGKLEQCEVHVLV